MGIGRLISVTGFDGCSGSVVGGNVSIENLTPLTPTSEIQISGVNKQLSSKVRFSCLTAKFILLS